MRRDPLEVSTLQPGAPVEVFASPGARACRERELVLRARGIACWKQQHGGQHRLLVDASQAEAALAELSAYEQENRDWPPRDEVPPAAPAARSATAIALALLVACYALAGWDAFDLGWGSLGAARADAIRGGEPWRAVTALFLHTGPVHLVSNLIFGALFGFVVAHAYGGGLGWLAILLAGALGNATNAWIQDPAHASVGASTAVFGAVGCLAGAEWRRRNLMRQRRLRRAAPFVIAVLILALHGVPQDEGVDVLAHVTGLAWGLPLGTLLPALSARAGARAGPQVLYGLFALVLVAFAWTAAFASAPA